MSKRTALAVLSIVLVPAVVLAGSGPGIRFTETEHDFGDVVHGKKPSVEMVFSNTGDETLIIKRLRSSCGCAKAVKGSRSVTPGSTGRIEARIDTNGMSPGRHSKTISVYSNDPAQRKTKLTFTFNVVRHITIAPWYLAKAIPKPEAGAVFSIEAVNHWTQPVSLRTSQSKGPHSGPTMIPGEVVVPPGDKVEFKLSIPVKSGPSASYVKGTATILTNDPLEKRLRLRYFIRFPKKGDG